MSSMKGLGRRVLTVMGETLRGGGRDKQKLPKDKFRKPNKGSGRFQFLPKEKDPKSVFVQLDQDMSFIASIIRKNGGAEAGNNIWWVTSDSNDKFRNGYSMARANFRDAKNGAKNGGGLRVLFDKDSTTMAKVLELRGQEFDTIYILLTGLKDTVDKKTRVIAVRVASRRVVPGQVVTGRVVASRVRAGQIVVSRADASRADASRADASHVVSVRFVAGRRVVPGCIVVGNVLPGRVVPGRVVAGRVVPGRVVKDVQTAMGELMRNAALLVKEDGGKIIVLHPRDSSLDLKEVAAQSGLTFEKEVKYDERLYPHFQPRMIGTDVEFDPSASSFYYFTL